MGAVLGHQRVGVYANSKTIDWALQDGLGTYLLAAQLGVAEAATLPAADLHQVEIDKREAAASASTSTTSSSPGLGQWD